MHGSEGQAAAGAIIKAFGSFVVGGNYVIGMIIFVILVLINFIVITKGSGRIAEVAARFTLDAMPGKQMAIDADLNAGMIDENEAKTPPGGDIRTNPNSMAPWTGPANLSGEMPSRALSSPWSILSAALSSVFSSRI